LREVRAKSRSLKMRNADLFEVAHRIVDHVP
jgi:hypothetical protein